MSHRDFPAVILAVVDGDTLVADLDLGFGIWKRKAKIRLYGVDAPELPTPEGQRAKRFLEQRLGVSGNCNVVTFGKEEDKYGRVLGDVFLDRASLSEEMKLLGIVKAYTGRGPKPWPTEKSPLMTTIISGTPGCVSGVGDGK